MVSAPLILASGSAARQVMLENAGLDFDVQPSDFAEEPMIKYMLGQGNSLPEIAAALAQEKAMAVAKDHPESLVVGADQVLDFEGRLLTKAADEAEARKKLLVLKGKSHTLISAVSIVRGEEVLWQHSDEAVLSMHDFDAAFLEEYCARAGEALTRAVGAYELESHGSWLFSSVQGNYFTILGMPLLPLLTYLKDNHGYGP